MDRRKFLCGTAAGLAAASFMPLWAQDTDRNLPRRPMSSVQAPYRLELQNGLGNSISEAASADPARAREILEQAIQTVDGGEDMLRQRVEARDNAGNPEWVRERAATLFENRRARQAFQRWFPEHASRQRDRALTEILVHGGDDYALVTIWAYAAISMAAGTPWQDIVDTLTETTGGRVALTRHARVDFSGEVVGTVSAVDNGIAIHFSPVRAGPRRLQRNEKVFAPAALDKRGYANGAHKVLTGAAAGAALGTLATGGAPGPGTVVGGIIGGLIGLAAAVEGDGDDGDDSGDGDGDSDASNASGGGTSVWDGNGECPPADQPYVLC